MRKTTMYFPADLDRALQERSKWERRPASEIVRDAIRRYLEADARPRPGIVGVAKAKPGFRAADDEAILDEDWGKR